MIYFNNKPVTIGTFPNKEIYVDTKFLKKEIPNMTHFIRVKFETNDDIIALILLRGQMNDMGFSAPILVMHYFPYSTMDHTDGSRPLSLKYIAGIINMLHFRRVDVMEAHSTVLEALIDKVNVAETSLRLLTSLLEKLPGDETPVICFPDAGAEKRYHSTIPHGLRTLTFQKTRDFDTGKITGMRCLDEINHQSGNTYIIIDDLCRGGRTFESCAQVLREAGAEKVLLCVTHLEPGAFDGILKDDSSVDKVYATDSCLPDSFNRHSDKLFLTKFQ